MIDSGNRWCILHVGRSLQLKSRNARSWLSLKNLSQGQLALANSTYNDFSPFGHGKRWRRYSYPGAKSD